MAHNLKLAEKIRKHLSAFADLDIVEKKMFGGLAFIVNGKMCINVSGDKLMCRFDPASQTAVAKQPGFEKMVMKGKELNGYCYLLPEGFAARKDFDYWIKLCLDFNGQAEISKTKRINARG